MSLKKINNILKLRLALGLSQKELGKKLNRCQSGINKSENGSKLSKTTAVALANLAIQGGLECSIDYYTWERKRISTVKKKGQLVLVET